MGLEALGSLRPFLLLALSVLAAWLGFRVLKRALAGRVGQLGRFVILVVFVGGYALSLALAATGAPSPFGWFVGTVAKPTLWVPVGLAALAVAWLALRELPFPLPRRLGFVLDSPLRRLLSPRDAVLDRIALGPGMRVLEVGCGTGHLTPELARRVKPGGQVFALDIQPGMVEQALARCERAGLGNVTGIVSPATELPVGVFDIDLVLMVHVLGEIDDRQAALRAAGEVLRPGGVLVVGETLVDPHYRFRTTFLGSPGRPVSRSCQPRAACSTTSPASASRRRVARQGTRPGLVTGPRASHGGFDIVCRPCENDALVTRVHSATDSERKGI